MLKFLRGTMGAAALVVTLGAAQFAVGHDITGGAQVAAVSADSVNRAAKSDRPAGTFRATGGTVTTQLTVMNDTSVVTRVPRVSALRDSKAAGKLSPRPVACEAPASVLTEVAKVMESGRCLT